VARKNNLRGLFQHVGAAIQLSEQLFGDAAINGRCSAQNATSTMALAAAGARLLAATQ
jgi:hypothetical protein